MQAGDSAHGQREGAGAAHDGERWREQREQPKRARVRRCRVDLGDRDGRRAPQGVWLERDLARADTGQRGMGTGFGFWLLRIKTGRRLGRWPWRNRCWAGVERIKKKRDEEVG